MKQQRRQGFTIIELAVCIVVLAILVTIAAVSYGNWRQRSAITSLTSDLEAVASAMEQEKNFSNGYPTTVPSSVELSKRVTMTVTTSSDRRSFCAQATTTDYAGLTYRYRQGASNPDGKPVEGQC